MAASEAQDAWIERVLGVELPLLSTGQNPAGLGDALAAWRQALETVGGQITVLQGVLRNSPDEDLQAIAEFGLNAMTGSHKIKLQAALTDTAADLSKAGKAAQLAGAFASHLAGDKRVAACDANPFGVRIAIRATLVPALTGLQRALQAARG